MPIINEGNGLIKVVFGTGDILVSPTKDAESLKYNGGLCLLEHEPGEIGRRGSKFDGMVVEELTNQRVYMIFNKVESLDIVIEELQRVRKEIIGAEGRVKWVNVKRANTSLTVPE